MKKKNKYKCEYCDKKYSYKNSLNRHVRKNHSKEKKGANEALSKESVQSLEQSFKNGYNVTEACSYAKVARSTFYYWMENDQEFFDKMTMAQTFVNRKAKQNIIKKIVESEDISLSQWWTSRKDPDFSEKIDTNVKQEVTEKIEPEDAQALEEFGKSLTKLAKNARDTGSGIQPVS